MQLYILLRSETRATFFPFSSSSTLISDGYVSLNGHVPVFQQRPLPLWMCIWMDKVDRIRLHRCCRNFLVIQVPSVIFPPFIFPPLSTIIFRSPQVHPSRNNKSLINSLYTDNDILPTLVCI